MVNPYEEYLNRIKAAESGGNKYAKNPFKGQTASGLFQFTKGTWEGMGYDWKDRFDEQKQTEAATKFTKYNDDYLKKKLGIKPNYADLYGAHFLGAAGYAKLYKASNEQPISSVMSAQEISVNPSYTKNKDGTLKTVGEVKAILAKKTGTAIPQTQYAKQEEQFTLETNKGELETAGEYTEPKEVSEAKQELVQAQNEENFVKELEQLGQQEQQVAEQEQFNYLQTPELFTVSDPQIQYTDQQPVMYAQDGGEIPIDNMGMWKYPNRTVIVPSGNITMSPNPITGEPFTHNILAISEQTGEQRVLKPNTNHRFKQTTSVKEIPLFQDGAMFNLGVLDQSGLPFTPPTLQKVLEENPNMGQQQGLMVGDTMYSPSGQLEEVVIPTKVKAKPNFNISNGQIDFSTPSEKLFTKEFFEEIKNRVNEEARIKVALIKEQQKGLKEFPKEIVKENLKGIDLQSLKDQSSVKKVQKFLDDRGYNLNPSNKFKNEGIDGVLGAITKEAIEDYNRNLGTKGYSSIKEGENELGQCKEKQCSEYMQNEIYRNIQPKVSQQKFRDIIGLKGDAWEVVNNIVKAGGKKINKGDVKAGDVVGIYNPTSSYLQEAKSGAGYTHTGIIDKVNPDGSYYILHNVHKKVGEDDRGEPIYQGREFRSKVDPNNKSVQGFGYTVKEVARPAYEKVEKGETKTTYKDINLGFNKELLQPEQQANVSKYVASLNDYKTKSKIAENYNLDEKEYQSLAKATLGILGQETKFGTDWRAKPIELVAGLREAVGLEEASRGAGRFKYKKNRPSDVTYLGINKKNFTDPDKVALNSMDKLAKDYKTLLDKGFSKKEAVYRAISAYNSGMGSKEKYNQELDVDYTNKVIGFSSLFAPSKGKEKYKTYLEELAESSPHVATRILNVQGK